MFKHEGIEKEFPSYFKNFKLPDGASESSIEVYRACKTRKVEKPSFLPTFEENNFCEPENPTEPSEYSLSVYEKPKDVKRFASLNGNYSPPWKIAKGTTEPCCGRVQRTSERTKEKTSHVDWWLYENALPHEHFEIIDDFGEYLNTHKQTAASGIN
ncbi:MAG: hypothetical protein FWG87_13755 [Defluviitaleaceae bacterium]|nr:hypothetical protein [Defluviitaleaceae bacterium]